MTASAQDAQRNGTAPVHTHSSDLDDASLGQLMSRFSEEVSRLVRDELSLAQVEAKQRAKRLGLGVGMFGAGGVLAFFGAGAAVAAGIIGLAHAVPAWLAALLIAGALFVVAGMVASIGKGSLAKGSPPVPTEAIDSTKADIAAVRQAVKHD